MDYFPIVAIGFCETVESDTLLRQAITNHGGWQNGILFKGTVSRDQVVSQCFGDGRLAGMLCQWIRSRNLKTAPAPDADPASPQNCKLSKPQTELFFNPNIFLCNILQDQFTVEACTNLITTCKCHFLSAGAGAKARAGSRSIGFGLYKIGRIRCF